MTCVTFSFFFFSISCFLLSSQPLNSAFWVTGSGSGLATPASTHGTNQLALFWIVQPFYLLVFPNWGVIGLSHGRAIEESFFMIGVGCGLWRRLPLSPLYFLFQGVSWGGFGIFGEAFLMSVTLNRAKYPSWLGARCIFLMGRAAFPVSIDIWVPSCDKPASH